jgi:Na+/proline symporter
MTQTSLVQWIILSVLSIFFFLISPRAKTFSTFFSANAKDGAPPNSFLLILSLVISWIMAKSVINAAGLGQSIGILGGIGYAVYYLSFLVAGFFIYQLRTQGGFSSIHSFLSTKYGRHAVILFTVLIGLRLFNEVWSNTIIIGSYFGEQGSIPYYLAIFLFSGLTLLYALKGGLRSSLITDSIQFLIFSSFLIIILGMILPNSNGGISQVLIQEESTQRAGINFILLAFIQVFSYPFHDPVLTDRAFLVSPQKTLKSFAIASVIGVICIVLFSMIGVYARINHLEGEPTLAVSKILGPYGLLLINLIMLSSAGSTLDSTLSSFSKLWVIDLKLGSKPLVHGRWAMVTVMIIGLIPVFFNPKVLDATTISGTMVLGLAPIFVLWNMKVRKTAFAWVVCLGIVGGLVYALKLFPTQWVFIDGKYGDILSINVLTTALCFIVYVALREKEIYA